MRGFIDGDQMPRTTEEAEGESLYPVKLVYPLPLPRFPPPLQ